MDQESFDTLLILKDIKKQDTIMHEEIPAITLRYLASGMDLENLVYVCYYPSNIGKIA